MTTPHQPGRTLRHLVAERAEWVFVVVALLAAVSATRRGPEADADVYLAGVFGVEIVVVGCYLVWQFRRGQRDSRRPWIVWIGVPVAVYLAALPDLLAGEMNDERTGTGESLLLFALVVVASVVLGVLAGFLVLLPAALALRGLVLAVTGRVEGVLVVVLAAFPLSIVAAGVAGALAMDDVPGVHDTSTWTGGAAMVMRAFGVHNGARIVDPTALAWFRALVVIDLLYVAVLCVAGASTGRAPRGHRRAERVAGAPTPRAGTPHP